MNSDSDAIKGESDENITHAAPGDNISTHNTTDVTSEGVAVDFLARWKLQNLEYLLPGSLMATLVSYYAMAGFLQYYYYYRRREQVTGASSLGFHSTYERKSDKRPFVHHFCLLMFWYVDLAT